MIRFGSRFDIWVIFGFDSVPAFRVAKQMFGEPFFGSGVCWDRSGATVVFGRAAVVWEGLPRCGKHARWKEIA